MKASARRLAVDILNRIDESGLFAEPLLDETLSGKNLTDIHDRRLLTEIVYGTLRMQGRLDWIVARFYKGDAAAMDRSVRNILRTALYQFFFTERIPAFAIVDEAVKIVKALCPAASGLVNAILRNVIRREKEIAFPDLRKDPAGHIAVVHSHPLWLVRRWIGARGVEDTLTLCRANNEVPPLTVRVNRLKAGREEVMQQLRSEGLIVEEAGVSPFGLMLGHSGAPIRESSVYKAGRLQVQDESSQLAASLLAPRPGEKILDACAGVGVKTTQLAEMMNNEGTIAAVDINGRKLLSLRANASRLGIQIIEPLAQDFQRKPDPAFRGAFDRILLDVPCSGTGTFRRNPEIKWRIAAADLQRHAAVQKKLLVCAAECLKPGGRLVYSTCSLMPEENEAVIKDFLSRHRDFRLIHPPAAIPASMVTHEGFFQTRPDRHGTDGFFAAVMIRQEVSCSAPRSG